MGCVLRSHTCEGGRQQDWATEGLSPSPGGALSFRDVPSPGKDGTYQSLDASCALGKGPQAWMRQLSEAQGSHQGRPQLPALVLEGRSEAVASMAAV